MQISFTRQHLKEAVAGLTKIIDNHTHLPVLRCVKIDANGKTVTMTGTNLEQNVRYTFPAAEVTGTHSLLIDLQYLKDLTKGADSEPVSIALSGEEAQLRHSIRGQSITRPVPIQPLEDFPPTDWAIKTRLVADFLASYRMLTPFASKDTTRLPLLGIAIDCTEKGEGKACMVATDGRRLTTRNHLTIEGIKDALIVPMSAFLSWSKLTGDALIGVTKDGKHLKVEVGSWEFVTKSIEATYPNWRQIIPGKPGDNMITVTEADFGSLKTILPTLPGDGVILRPQDGSVAISAMDRDTGKKTVVALTGGSTFTGTCDGIGVNRGFWLDALEAGFRVFQFTDDRCPLYSSDGQGGTHILMPMRLDHTPAPSAEQPEPTPDPVVPAEPEVNTPASATAAEPAQTNPNTGDTHMPKAETNPAPEIKETALDRLLTHFEEAKAKVREANSALVDLASAIKDAIREDKHRRAEVDNVREMLGKVQALKVG